MPRLPVLAVGNVASCLSVRKSKCTGTSGFYPHVLRSLKIKLGFLRRSLEFLVQSDCRNVSLFVETRGKWLNVAVLWKTAFVTNRQRVTTDEESDAAEDLSATTLGKNKIKNCRASKTTRLVF